jgi:hypothetical protein
MHLVDNGAVDTLSQAADLIGATPEQLKSHADLNIRGAAALIATLARDLDLQPASLEEWAPALEAFTGLDPSVRGMQVQEYYRRLAEGADVINGRGVPILLEPVAVDADRVDQLLTLEPARRQGAEYHGALWNPADSSNYGSTRSTIEYWMNHWIGVGTYAGAISWFKNPSSNVSAHFVIRNSDGQITQMVPINRIAYHAGVTLYNQRAIAVEHEAIETNPGMWNSVPMLTASTDLARHFCDLYGIPKTRSYILGHGEVRATACPGPLPWTTWMEMLNADVPPEPRFLNRLANGGFESDTAGWVKPSATTWEVVTNDVRMGTKALKISRSGAYHTVWQNPLETNGEQWRTTAWIKRLPSTTLTEFGWKDQAGVTRASTPISSPDWAFYQSDYLIGADVDVQVWGTGGSGLLIDNVRAGNVSRMNWITDWVWAGPFGSSIATDWLATSGGEANVLPAPGISTPPATWAATSAPDGFIDVLPVLTGTTTNRTVYAHVYVQSTTARENVSLLVGSDDGVKVWLNGELIHTNDANRSHDYFAPDTDVVEGLSLLQGENRLMVKVRNGSGAFSFSARLADADGNALPGLSTTLTSTLPPPVGGDLWSIR